MGQIRRVGDDMDAIYSFLEFYSDGTLGPYGKYSNLTVVGWGWVVIGPPPMFALIGGEYGTLEPGGTHCRRIRTSGRRAFADDIRVAEILVGPAPRGQVAGCPT